MQQPTVASLKIHINLSRSVYLLSCDFCRICVKLHLGDKETKRQTQKTKRFLFLSFVRLFVFLLDGV